MNSHRYNPKAAIWAIGLTAGLGMAQTINVPAGGDLFKAMQQAPAGATLRLTSGEYRLQNGITVQKAVRLVGEGRDKTHISYSGNDGVVFYFDASGTSALSDLSVEYKGSAATDVLVFKQGQIDVSNSRISGGVTKEKYGRGLVIEGKASATIENSEFCKNSSNGVLVLENTRPILRFNRLEGNGGSGIYMAQQASPTLENNTLRDNKVAGIVFDGQSSGIASNNTITDNLYSGIIVNDQARPTLEDNTSSNNKQSGIAYFGNAGGVARGNELSENDFDGIYVSGQANPMLEGNEIFVNGNFGIEYEGQTAGTAKGNIINENNYAGIIVKQQAQPLLEKNDIFDNLQSGIYYLGGVGGVAKNNYISGNIRHGIEVRGQAVPTLEGNTIEENLESGIWFSGSSRGVAKGNIIQNNTYHGVVVLERATPTLENNTMLGNTYGIYMLATSNPTLTSNTLDGNNNGPIYKADITRSAKGNASDLSTEVTYYANSDVMVEARLGKLMPKMTVQGQVVLGSCQAPGENVYRFANQTVGEAGEVSTQATLFADSAKKLVSEFSVIYRELLSDASGKWVNGNVLGCVTYRS